MVRPIKVIDHIKDHKDQYIDQLIELLKIPSVSTDPNYKEDVSKCADFLANQLKTAGLKNIQVTPTKGHPIVYADWCHQPDRPTVLIYGHYDVQPPEPLELWDNPPFEPTIKDNALYARGVADDKGQLFCHIKAIDSFLKTTQALPLNIKLVFEGEEEIGSPNLASYLESNKDQLNADIALISDTPMLGKDQPSICTSLRGLIYLQLNITSANADLHSGQHGGAVPNAIQCLTNIISALKDDQGKVQIPGFYDDVLDIPSEIQSQLKTLEDPESYKKEAGVTTLVGEAGFSYLEQRWLRPTLDCNGIYGGYTGEGAKTVIPAKASAKISMRLVANQDPQHIVQRTKSYLQSLVPDGITLEIKEFAASSPVQVNTDNPAIKAASESIQDIHNKAPILNGEGGSIPVVGDLKEVLGVDTVLLGFNLPDDGIHAPNERFGIENFMNGIQVASCFYETYSKK